MIDVLARPVAEIAALVQRGEVSALEVADASLARIAAYNAEFGAFLTVQADEARAAAKAIDAKRARGERLGPLAGVPVGLKDAITVRDAPTTAGSLALTRAPRAGEPARDPARGFRSPYDATVVERLRAADAVLPGKCNLDEFAMGSSTENSAFYPAKNPWDPTRAPGGSSGGSAVAVSLAMTPASLGSDTGGSIRQPAALCGVVGVKPTYGRVSRSGLVAFASSLDQIGPFAADVRSAARVLDTIAGHDPRDATSVAGAPLGCEAACGRDVTGLRVGVPAEYFAKGIDPDVEASVCAAITALEAAGCTLVPVELPHTRYAVATYYVIVTAECSSNLARYDGVRYGLRVPGEDLEAMYAATRGAGFGAEVKRRILLGTYVLSAGYYDAYYLRAQRARTLVRRDFEAAFADVDAIAAPVSPTAAFALGEKVDDPLAMYLADVYTLPASLAGLPAMSVPCAPLAATATSPELPVGLQLIGPPFAEARLFALAHAFERVSPARGRRPPPPRATP